VSCFTLALASSSIGAIEFTVADGDGLRAALSAAIGGDVIRLQAGNEFVGPFTLPEKTGIGWITLQSTDCETPGLPSPGNRVKPADAPCMPRLVPKRTGTLSVSDSVVVAAPNAGRYRFSGIEIYADRYISNLVWLGNCNETSISELPHSFIFERSYIHAGPDGARRGIAMNGGNGIAIRRLDGSIDWTLSSGGIQVVDSWIGNIVDQNYESQAVASWNGAGPFRLENNYLEASGENVIFGGADPSIENLIPSDLEIRGNHFRKPLEWQTQGYVIKNLFELKNARRVVVRGNVFENNWIGADQTGGAIVITPRNQDGESPWSTVRDLDFSYNKVLNSPQGMGILGHDDINESERTENLSIRHNFFDLQRPDPGGRGRLFQISNGAYDVTIDHNTGFQDRSVIWAYSRPNELVRFTNNLVRHNDCADGAACGIGGDGTRVGDDTIEKYFPNSVFRQNVMFDGGFPADYTSEELCGIDGFPAGVAFAGDGSLAPDSPYADQGVQDGFCADDGLDVGADMTTVNALTSRAVAGVRDP
jgi:hypothetical protein